MIPEKVIATLKSHGEAMIQYISQPHRIHILL